MIDHRENTEPWMADALCASIGGDFWFPDRGHGDERVTRRAKAVCRDCPVRAECLDYALRNAEPYGIYGGTTPFERRKMTRGGAA